MTNSDWIAISSSVVALCALAISVFQTRATIRHNKLQTKPFLDIVALITNKLTNLSIENHGLGPAIIKSIVATYKGGAYQLKSVGGIDSLTDQLPAAVRKQMEIHQNHLDSVTPLQAGKSLLLIDIHPETDAAREAAKAFLDALNITVEYECVYGQKYSSTLKA